MTRPPLRAAIVGASGGIGAALVAELQERHRPSWLYALSRNGISAAGSIGLTINYDEPASIAEAAAIIEKDGPLDLVIVATGLLHGDGLGPEKSLAELEVDRLERVFHVNTIGPALVMRCFLPLMRREEKSVFAALSARVGSISDNRLGGWYGYRASKAALNQIIRTAAIEHARRWKDSAVIGLHPGTVDTGLSAPFQKRVPEGKLFTPQYSARKMLDVIENVSGKDSGKIFAWDGQEIAP